MLNFFPYFRSMMIFQQTFSEGNKKSILSLFFMGFMIKKKDHVYDKKSPEKFLGLKSV